VTTVKGPGYCLLSPPPLPSPPTVLPHLQRPPRHHRSFFSQSPSTLPQSQPNVKILLSLPFSLPRTGTACILQKRCRHTYPAFRLRFPFLFKPCPITVRCPAESLLTSRLPGVLENELPHRGTGLPPSGIDFRVFCFPSLRFFHSFQEFFSHVSPPLPILQSRSSFLQTETIQPLLLARHHTAKCGG